MSPASDEPCRNIADKSKQPGCNMLYSFNTGCLNPWCHRHQDYHTRLHSPTQVIKICGHQLACWVFPRPAPTAAYTLDDSLCTAHSAIANSYCVADRAPCMPAQKSAERDTAPQRVFKSLPNSEAKLKPALLLQCSNNLIDTWLSTL